MKKSRFLKLDYSLLHRSLKLLSLAFTYCLLVLPDVRAQTTCSVQNFFSDPTNPTNSPQQRGTTYTCGNSGYFSLSFDNNFTQAEKDVACAVFSYLSSTIQNSGGQTVNIDFVKEVPSSGAGAEAESYFLEYSDLTLFPCGIAVSKVWKRIVIGYDLEDPSNDFDGRIRITPNINWYTGFNPAGIGNDEADLYTAILHEALHLFGFTSLIGNNGSPLLNGRYSLWDTHLAGMGENEGQIIEPVSNNPNCCNDYAFNSTVYSSLPQDLFNDGCDDTPPNSEIWFGTISPVSSNETQTLPNINIAQYLAHIDEDCAGTTYVMNAVLEDGETKRVLSDDELNILKELGYIVMNNGSKTCYAEAINDLYTFPVFVDETIEIPFNLLLNNDFLPNDYADYEIEYFPCDVNTTQFISVTQGNESFIITGLQIKIGTDGKFTPITLCYTVKCSDGSIFCSQAAFTIYVLENYPEIAPCTNSCADIACLGKFDRFTPGHGAYLNQSQTGYFTMSETNENLADFNLNVIGFSSEANGSSPNNFLVLIASEYEGTQGINLELDEPILPGETVSIRFNAATKFSGNGTALQLYGSSSSPCGVIGTPGTNCSGSGLNQCELSGENYTPFCIQNDILVNGVSGFETLINFGNPAYPYQQNFGNIFHWLNSEMDWGQPTEICWTNNTDQIISNLLFYETATLLGRFILVDDISVLKMPSSAANFEFEETDGCTVEFSSLPAISGCDAFEHSWNFAGLGNSSLANPSFEFPAAGIYTVTHEVCLENGCGCQTFTLDVVIDCQADVDLICPCLGIGYNLGSTNMNETRYLSDYLTVPSVINGGCIAIGGRFVVDEDWKLDGVTLQMQPGAEIVTLADADVLFEVYNSTIESCQKMWKGITIDVNPTNGEAAVFKFTGNHIRDAQFAIRTKGKSSLKISGNHFERDFVGIFFDSNGKSPSFSSTFKDNHFTTTTTPLKMGYDGQSPNPGTNMFAGIYVKNTPFLQIGSPNSSSIVNYFTNLRNGIVVENSQLWAYFCQISDLKGISTFGAPIWQVRGVGVYMKNGLKSKLISNTIGGNDNSRVGIRAINSTLEARNNNIHVKLEGIVYRDAPNADANFSNNIIGNCQYGIAISNCPSAQLLVVENNQISCPNSTGIGILVSNSYPDLVGNARISKNVPITVEKGLGISLNSCSNWKVSDNDITINSVGTNSATSEDAAIRLTDAHDNQLWRNFITGPGAGAGEYRGIFAYNSPNVLYCCNDIDETKYGLRFEGPCSGTTTVGTTQFRNHVNGLYYDPSGVTGIQIFTGNFWNLNNPSWDAYYTGNPDFAYLSGFDVDDSQSPYDASPPLNTGQWFNVFQNGEVNTCINWPTCDEEEWLLPEVNENDVRVANGDLTGLASGEVVQWLAEQRLYAKLVEHPQLLQGNLLMQAFKQSRDIEDIGQLHGVSEGIDKLWSFDPLTAATVQSQLQSIGSLSSNAGNIASALPGATPAENQSLVQLLDNALASLDAVMAAHQNTTEAFRLSRMAQIASYEASNENLSLNFPPAANEQAVNALKLDYWQNGNLTNNQLSILFDIAKDCPLVGGNAVFEARGLYEAITESRHQWEFLERCFGANGRSVEWERTEVNVDSPSSGFAMYPNPTSGELTVSLFGEGISKGSLSVFDLSGKCHLHNQTVLRGDNQVGLGSLPTGLYFITVTTDEGLVLRQKLVLSK